MYGFSAKSSIPRLNILGLLIKDITLVDWLLFQLVYSWLAQQKNDGHIRP